MYQIINFKINIILFYNLILLSLFISPLFANPVLSASEISLWSEQCENWTEYPKLLKKSKAYFGLPGAKRYLIEDFKTLINRTLVESPSPSKQNKLAYFKEALFQIETDLEQWQDDVLKKLQVCEPYWNEIINTAFGHYYALVIGINHYKQWAKLETAVNDAKQVAKVLQEQYGFIIEDRFLLLDDEATYDNILSSLDQLSEHLTEQDQLLIYYAGHGYRDNNNQAYWLPIDAEKKNQNTPHNWISANDITAKISMATTKARKVLIIADSCYSGTFTHNNHSKQTWVVGEQQRETNLFAQLPTYLLTENKTFLLKNAIKPSRILIASGGDEPVADIGGGKHSVFTQALLKGLQKRPESVFTAHTLFNTIAKEVVSSQTTHQTPEYRFIDPNRRGDFIFKRPGPFFDQDDVI